MQVLSVNVGKPRTVEIARKPVTTSIFKEPVAGRVRVGPLSLEGDSQSDPSVHGGEHMAVYVYPSEHHAYWQRELGRDGFAPGQFGENLTTRGLSDDAVRVGDCYRIGSSLLQVTHPRIPCHKLAFRMQAGPDFTKRFLASRRTGFYLRVLESGELGAGDAIELIDSDPASVTIAEYIDTYAFHKKDTDALRRILDSRDLSTGPKGARRHIEDLLRKAGAS